MPPRDPLDYLGEVGFRIEHFERSRSGLIEQRNRNKGSVTRAADGKRSRALTSRSDHGITIYRHGDLPSCGRIDRLPSESRRALRVASVIACQFGVSILERLLEGSSR